MTDKFVTLAHGAGGKQTSELIDRVFQAHFANPDLTADDAAVLSMEKGRIAFTTDGFIVSPYEFAGGNIGKLSICGTVNANTSGKLAKAGDAVIVSGDIGRHGCTILLARDEFGIEADVTSDCAPLWANVKAMFDVTNDIHVIRDATRGGVGTVLYEIAGQSGVGITLDAEKIPVADEVKGVCGMLGLEPLYLACEGRLVIFAPKDKAEDIVSALRKCKNSENAAVIGEVTEDNAGRVVMKTEIGSQTLLPQPGGELLPRIC